MNKLIVGTKWINNEMGNTVTIKATKGLQVVLEENVTMNQVRFLKYHSLVLG